MKKITAAEYEHAKHQAYLFGETVKRYEEQQKNKKVTKKDILDKMNKTKEIEIRTMKEWLKSGAIKEDCRGEENVYFVDQFDNRYFCKCL